MEFAISYLVGGAIVAAIIASSKTVEGTWWEGKPMKRPRLVMGIAALIIWPWILWKMLTGPLPK